MTDVLTRPLWHALAGPQDRFAVGDVAARRFRQTIGPLGAARDDSETSMAALGALVRAEGIVALLQEDASPVPPGAQVETVAAGVQMVARSLEPPPKIDGLVQLSPADAAEMLELATLTKPGPFATETHLLGTFWGVRQEGRLAAMAGERMKPPGYTEVSGVCTHPDFRGRGYAGALSRLVATKVLERGETPFLHAYTANTGAISLYRSLGFEISREVVVTILTPAA